MNFITGKIANLDRRTALVGKNVLVSFLLKGWGAIVQLLLVPFTLMCLSQYEYGLWLTVNSILIWIDTMDLGLGNGLRNRLSESLAHNNREQGQKLVSTAFVMVFVIVIPLVSVCCLFLHNFNCHQLLNVDPAIVPNLEAILIYSLCFVGATFILKFIGNIYLALQLPAVNNLLVVGGQTLTFLIILIFSKAESLSLLHIAIIYTASPIIIYGIAYPVTFHRYTYLRPSLKKVEIKEIKPLFSLSILFFLLQFAGMMIFATSNLIITKILSPMDVTPFQIAYRYFAITNVLFTIISAPLWSATTDAYATGDYIWIRKTMKRMRVVLIFFATGLAMMLLISPLVYRIWIGSDIKISLLLSSMMAFYMFILILGTCYSNIICGFGKIRLITLITVAEAVIFIPLAVTLCSRWGVTGILSALILVNSISATVNLIQCKYLIYRL